MKTRALVTGLIAAAGLATAASAQTTTSSGTCTLTVVYLGEDPAVANNGNGIIDPGEAALIGINCVWGTINTTGSFSPAVGTTTSGTIRGHGGGFVDLLGTQAVGSVDTTGTWDNDPNGANGYGVQNGSFIVTGGNGSPTGNNLRNIQWGQLPTSNTGINTSNAVPGWGGVAGYPSAIWVGSWHPNSYATRLVGFNIAAAVAAGSNVVSVIFKTAVGPVAAFIPASSVTLAGSGNVIPIAPAPASLALLGLGGLIAGRRRR